MPPNRLVRVICLALAAACLLAAVARAAAVGLYAVSPAAVTSTLQCGGGSCRLTTDPLRLVPSSARMTYGDAPHRLALERHLARTEPRLMLAAASLLTGLPLCLIYVGLAVVFWCCAQAQPFHRRAVIWIRRVAAAAVAGVVATPLSTGLQSAATLSAFGVENPVRFTLDIGDFTTGLFLSASVWAAAWAMSQGRALEHETSLYV